MASTSQIVIMNSIFAIRGDFVMENANHKLINTTIIFVNSGIVHILTDDTVLNNCTVKGIENHGIFIDGVNNTIINNTIVDISGTGSYGVYSFESGHVLINNSYLEIDGPNAFISVNSNNITLSNSYLTQNPTGNTILIKNTHDVLLDNNIAMGGLHGPSTIRIDDYSSDINVVNNRIESYNYVTDNLHVDNISYSNNTFIGSVGETYGTNHTFFNNSFSGNLGLYLVHIDNSTAYNNTISSKYEGIWLSAVENVNIYNNSIRSDDIGVKIAGGSTSTSIFDNYIYDSMFAMTLEYSDYILVDNNTIDTYNGISINRLDHSSIVNNQINTDQDSFQGNDLDWTLIRNNTINSVNTNGFSVLDTTYSEINNNTITAGKAGLLFQGSSTNNNVTDNMINADMAIQIHQLRASTLANNTLIGRIGVHSYEVNWGYTVPESKFINNLILGDEYGVYADYDSHYISYYDNMIRSNGTGVLAVEDYYKHSFVNNTVISKDVALFIGGTQLDRFRNYINNTFISENNYSVYIMNGNNNYFEHNLLYSNFTSSVLYLGDARINTFINNDFTGSAVGLDIFYLMNDSSDLTVNDNLVLGYDHSTPIQYQWDGNSTLIYGEHIKVYYPGLITLSIWTEDANDNIFHLDFGMDADRELILPIIKNNNDTIISGLEEFDNYFLSWNITEEAIRGYQLYIDGNLIDEVITYDNYISTVQSFAVGEHTVELFVFDTSGNNASHTYILSVIDTKSPVISIDKTTFRFIEGTNQVITVYIHENNPSHMIVKIEDVVKLNTSISTDNQPIDGQFSFEYLMPSAGNYSMTLEFYDIFGNKAILELSLIISVETEEISISENPTTTDTTTTPYYFPVLFFITLVYLRRYKK